MAEVLDRGVIEIVGDARKLRASVEEAKKAFRTLGEGQKDISRAASASIDRYIAKLQEQNLTLGKSAREVEIFRLAQRGASNEQIKTADAALRVQEANKRVADAAAAQAARIREAQARSANVDQLIAGIKQQTAEFGKSQQQIDLYRLKLQGASDEQLKAAGAALRLRDAQKKTAEEMVRAADAQKKAQQKSAGIDAVIAGFREQNAVLGKSTREAELFRLSMKGASAEQLKAADNALKFAERQQVVESALTRVKAVAITAGAAIATAFAFKVKGTIDFLDQLNAVSKSTGIAVGDLAGLKLLAEQTGGSFEGLTGAIRKQTVEMGKDAQAFKELGITATDPIQAFGQLADIFKILPSLQERNALANKVFGKSWDEVSGTLLEGSRRIDETIKKGKELSGVTEENVKTADEFKSAVAELSIAAASFGAEFIPTLTKIVNLLIEGKRAAGDFFASLGAAIGRPATMQDELAKVEAGIAKVKETRDAFQKSSKGSLFARLFNADDLAIANAQLKDLEGQRAKLQRKIDFSTEGVPELGSHLTPAQDAARQAAATAAGARVRKFLDEGKKATDQSRQIAAAQLALDIEQIRKAGEARVDAFQGAERLMQAQRSAGLIDDKTFFESRRAFIQAIAQEQEKALQAEIARLGKEKFTGEQAVQDRLENQKKIADAEAKLAKIQADAVIATAVNATEQTGALNRIEQAYKNAEEAARDYLASVERANAREAAGVGRGQRFRENQAAISQIEEKAITERRRLQGERRREEISQEDFERYLQIVEDTYRREVELYQLRTEQIERSQADWLNGATEALTNYVDETRNLAAQVENAFTNAFRGLEDFFVDITTNGIKSFKDLKDAANKLATSIVADVNRILIKQNITAPLAEFIQGNLGVADRVITGRGGGGEAGGFVDTAQTFGDQIKRLVSGIFGGGSRGVAVPVTEGVISKAGIPGLGGAGAGAAFQTQVTASGTTFATAVTTSGTTVATELTAAGATTAGELAASGTTLAGEVIGAGTSFAGQVTAAAAQITAAAAQLAAAASGSSISDVAGGFGFAEDFFGGFFAEGGSVAGPGTPTSDSVPAMLSNQEFVVRAAAATEPGAPQFLKAFNERGLAAALSTIERPSVPSSTIGRASPEGGVAVQPAPERKARVIPFAKGGELVTARRKLPLVTGDTALMGEAGPEAVMPLRRTDSGQHGLIVAGRPDLTLPVTRDLAGNMAVDAGAIERFSETIGGKTETIERIRETVRQESAARPDRAPLSRPAIPRPPFADHRRGVEILTQEIRPALPATRAPAALAVLRTSIRPQAPADAAERVLRAPAGIPERSRAQRIAVALTAGALSMPLAAAPVLVQPERPAPIPIVHQAAASAQPPSVLAGGSTISNAHITNNATMAAPTPAAAAAVAESAGMPFVGSFERGIPFIPRAGIALVHEREAILNAEQNRKRRQADTDSGASTSRVNNITMNWPQGVNMQTVNQGMAALRKTLRESEDRNFD